MLLALVPHSDSSVTLSPAALTLVSQLPFCFLANAHLDAGKTVDQTALLMQTSHHDAFNRTLHRSIVANDILAARDHFTKLIPSPSLRFDMTNWVLTLSREFRRVAGELTDNNPQYSQEEADRLTEHFKSFLSKRTFTSGYCFKSTIQPDDIKASFQLYPEGMVGKPLPGFSTPEAAIFEWCRLVPFRRKDKSMIAYAKYFGDQAIIETLFFRCLKACRAPLPSFMSDEQKKAHEGMGVECFWTMTDYINWLTHHNPLDHG